MMLTLRNNSNEYDLYKNPIVDILLPEEIEIEIKEIKQLNFERSYASKKCRNKRKMMKEEKILRITLEGEQQSYSKQLMEGIQAAIKGDITIPNTVPSKRSEYRSILQK